ncbi:MAG TPA: aromatic aminobenezylarsenical efflux permease ArsG family transporter [bacterium]|nr:aromatic aminobenezylarsenical efflux permease ArsG family transporter [bacterium]HPS30571.1 aromatic aminobenezylarsenical efflux permease ArsG family transporter [bacterium]
MIIAMISAIWLGILTSISPCPLATNIAAVSYLSKDISKKKSVMISSVFYTLGRMAAYTFVSAVIVVSIISTPKLSHFLQIWGVMIIGPLLIVTGAFLLEIFTIPMPSFGEFRIKPERFGLIGAFMLGFIFAMSFCPVSAALFFGSLVPLAVSAQSKFILPLIYGIGTALPVILFAILLSISAEKVSLWFRKITAAEIWIRRVFGIVLIVIGVYYTVFYVFLS